MRISDRRAKSAPPRPPRQPNGLAGSGHGRAMKNQMKISIGAKTFKATLENNAAVTKLKTMLPLRLSMTELNGNEKYHHLPASFPTDAKQPATVQAGDLMLFGNNTLVLFYKTFSTAYRYTRLGRIDDPTGLATVLGAGNIAVIFESE